MDSMTMGKAQNKVCQHSKYPITEYSQWNICKILCEVGVWIVTFWTMYYFDSTLRDLLGFSL